MASKVVVWVASPLSLGIHRIRLVTITSGNWLRTSAELIKSRPTILETLLRDFTALFSRPGWSAIRPTSSGNTLTIGFDSTNVPFAWVTQNSLDSFSEIFSHELVEACTDPEGTGWTSTTACSVNHSGWCEIGDVCEGNAARVNGVLVQRY